MLRRMEPLLPFIGSEALNNGRVDAYRLRTRYRALYPDVYLPVDAVPTLAQRTHGAWLWSHREGVISGLAAAASHGSKWIDDAVPIELIWPNARPPRGIRTSADRLLKGEFESFEGKLITTPARTAFDLGRRLRGDDAVARIDALSNATGLRRSSIEAVAAAHPGVRNMRRLRTALDLYDAGAQSPKETWLRLIVERDGHPRPQTQIPVRCADRWYYLDMGWPEVKIAVEYDGGHHYATPEQIRYDIGRLEALTEMGWIVIRVVAGTHPSEVRRRVRRAWLRRDCGEREILAG